VDGVDFSLEIGDNLVSEKFDFSILFIRGDDNDDDEVNVTWFVLTAPVPHSAVYTCNRSRMKKKRIEIEYRFLVILKPL